MKSLYKAIIIFLLPLTILLTTVQFISFDTNHYLDKYEEYDIPRTTGISLKDLHDITDKLTDYLKDDTDNLRIEKHIDGEKEEVFGEREVLHMIDVKELFIKGLKIRNISLILLVLSIIAITFRDRRSLGQALIVSSILSLGSMILLSLLMYIDFNKYFTYFHEMFFSNDLWLLDPKTDVLIQMLPLEFFYSMATKIAIIFIIELIIVILLGLYLNRSYKNTLLR